MTIGLATDGFYGSGGGVTYRMRARDIVLDRYVYWNSTAVIDSTGANYTGPGPLVDIVVQQATGKS